MSAAFVLDCSTTIAWHFEQEATVITRRVKELISSQSAVVPPLWYLEVINTLARAERAGRTRRDEVDEFLCDLEALDIQADNDPPQTTFTQVLPLYREHGLTAYDAAYLEVALRRKLPLATLDNELRATAKKAGVKLLGK